MQLQKDLQKIPQKTRNKSYYNLTNTQSKQNFVN